MSISQNFPNTRPSLNLNFARSKTLDPRITFSRTSTGTYVDESGFIRDAVADEPRFDHDPETGECLGLLVEESRVNNYHKWNSTTDTATNLSSAYIDTQTVSSVLTPRGVTATAYTATKTGNSSQYHGLNGGANTFSISANTSVSASAYIKEFNSSDYRLYFVIAAYNASTDNRRYILYRARPSTGEWIYSTVHSNWSTPVINVKDVGNGWYRFEISSTNTYEAGWNVIEFSFQLLNENNAQFYDPPTANTHGLYLSSPQFELGNFSTSYMPTNNDSNGSRTPDNVSMTGDNFSDWYNSSEWTLMIAARRNYSGNFLTYPNLARINDGTINNTVLFYGAQGSTQFTNYGIYSGGVNRTDYVAINVPTTSQFKMIQALKENDSTFGVNGTLTTTDTSVLMPVGVNQLLIGSDGATSRWGATIQQLTYYPVRLPNSTLQTLTK